MSSNHEETTLLDSSLINKYKRNELHFKSYNLKVVDCGDFVRIYEFDNIRYKELDSFKELKKIDTDNLYKKENINKSRSILITNLIRSNNHIQNLARKNCHIWNCFITLTYAENVTDIEQTNKDFNYWVSNVRKLKKDFKYLAVPEFQKRGAVHYHVLSNLILDDVIIFNQKIKKGDAINYDTLYDIKYWNKGFCRVDFVKGDFKKIFSYLTKYMLNDIDNRLFGKRRYFYSRNLDKPITNYCNDLDIDYITNLLNDKELEFSSIYLDRYTKTDIKFYEFKKKSI